MEAFLSGLVLTTLLSSLKGFFLSELLSEGRSAALTLMHDFATMKSSCGGRDVDQIVGLV
jgi:hypothetical protein